nr:EOG090X0POW [Cyclestheria hislopi]
MSKSKSSSEREGTTIMVESDLAESVNEDAVVIFADGFDGNVNQMEPSEGNQHVSIGDDGITIVVTPENEHQVSELLRALQASHSEEVQILTEATNDVQPLVKIKEETDIDTTEKIDMIPKRKRGRPSKCGGNPTIENKKAKLIELALQEANAGVFEETSNIKSSRLREKAAKQGGLRKLWLSDSKEDSDDGEEISVEHDKNDLKSDGESETHKCESCPEIEFSSLEDLKNHRKDFHRATFHCDICGTGFEDQIYFFEHLKIHYEKPKKMRGRPRKVQTPTTPVHNTKVGEELTNFSCGVCNKEFRNNKALDAHLRNAHPDAITKAYHCTQCNTSFRFKEAMETHVENSHGEKSKTVIKIEANDVVKEGESSRDDEDQENEVEVNEEMDEENEVQGEEEYNEKDGDGEGEEDLEALQASGITDYDPAIDGHCCQLCGAVFSAKKRLIQHLKEDHHIGFRRGRRPKYPPVETAEDGTYPCPVCKRTFTHKNSLAYHVRTHAGDRPHQCEICGKSFFANGALKVHMRVHTGARPYKCNDCGREFRQWGDLKYHFTSLHSGVRQYQCEFCGKSFARKYSLIVHRRVHTGERNYKCEFCGKGFRASSYLLNHRRIHTGEKPHPCPVCYKAFRMRSDMKRHMQMHARDGSDVSLLLACAEQGIDPLEAITADPDTLAALREKTAATLETVKRGDRSRRNVLSKGRSEEATAVATIQEDEDDEGSVMLTIVPTEDGEMVAVPVHVEGDHEDQGDEGTKALGQVDSMENTESHDGTVQELQLVNEDGEVQEGLEAVTVRDPNTNTLYVWSVFANPQMK